MYKFVFVFQTTEKETVTFLTDENGERNIYAIPGIHLNIISVQYIKWL